MKDIARMRYEAFYQEWKLRKDRPIDEAEEKRFKLIGEELDDLEFEMQTGRAAASESGVG